MKIFSTFIILFLFGNLNAQVIAITDIPSQTFYCPTVVKDTVNIIYIHGRVTRQGDPKTPIAKATIQLKNTDLLISSDSLGYYWLNISEMIDTKTNFILQCSFVNHQAVEKSIDHKIEKTMVVNFELALNGGIVPPETTQVKPVKKKKKQRRKQK